MRRSVYFLVFMTGLLVPAAASSRSLLPQPQKVRPGEGRLLLKSLNIRFAMIPATEDSFAACVALSALLRFSCIFPGLAPRADL